MNNNNLVLIVDDEPDMCWAFEWIFRGMGFHTASAQSGRDAIRLLEQIPFRFAFVDVRLPDVDGVDLAKELQRLQPDLPIVLVSGHFYEDDSDFQQRMREASVRGFIGKPFLLEEVRQAAFYLQCDAPSAECALMNIQNSYSRASL
jgi:DNA-binding NtrC family response regulator